MATQLFANNASSSLASGITNVATSLTLATGQGALFPSPTGGDWFLLTLTQGTGAETSWEIVKVTARATDVLTIVRAQESTTAAAWNAGAKAEARLTAGSLIPAVAGGQNGLMLGSDKTKLDAITGTHTGTNTGDNAVNSLYSGLVSNATHTGDVSGATILTLAAIITAAGPIGSASAVPVITFDAKGRLTAVSSATITPAAIGAQVAGTYATGTGTASGTNTGDNAVNSLYSGLVTNATHTGDVTGSGALTIANSAVTYAKMQNVSATSRVLGRITAGAGVVEELTGANLATIIGITNTAANVASVNGATGAVTLTNLGLQNFTSGATVSGSNTGDETLATIKTKLGITTLSGSNTGDQVTLGGYSSTGVSVVAGNWSGAAYWGLGSHASIGHLLIIDQIAGNSGGLSFAGTTDVNLNLGTNRVLHAGNYTSYAPSLTGSGASGTWGISVTGSAGSAPASDVYAWAKAATKPSYAFNEISSAGTATATVTTLVSIGQRHAEGGDIRLLGISGADGGWIQGVNDGIRFVDAGWTRTNFSVTNAGVGYFYGTVSASNFSGSHSGTSSGTNTGDQTNISGNAATATTATAVSTSSLYTTASSLYADTLESYASADWLEIVYYSGVGVRIGQGANGSKPLYASALYDAGNRVYSAGNPQTNISGNAATATNSTQLGGYTNTNYMAWFGWGPYDGNTIAENRSGFSYAVNCPYAGNLIYFAAGGYGLQLNSSYNTSPGDLAFRARNGDASSWNAWKVLLHSSNYTSYSPSLTGSGASGTWGISISGTAAAITSQANSATTACSVTASASTLVQRNPSGYIFNSYINTTDDTSSGPSLSYLIAKCGDDYHRSINQDDLKKWMGYNRKATYRRVDSSSDINYHTGSIGWSSWDMGQTGLWAQGSCFFDVWSGSNFPPSTSHVHGFQAMHYTTGSAGYGMRICSQYDQPGTLWTQNVTAGTVHPWYKIWTNATLTSVSQLSNDSGYITSLPASVYTSAARPGPTRLYRNDNDSYYNVQTSWCTDVSGYWSLRGYAGDSFHAHCWVGRAGYADTAGSAPASDVYSWAKASTKPTYTAAEVGAGAAPRFMAFGTLTNILFN